MKKIAIQSPGDMGHSVGNALRSHGGLEILTCLAGRSALTRTRAERAGFRDIGDLDTLVREVDMVLSILPPDQAIDMATAVAAAMKRTGASPAYADCNAVSPMTAREVAKIIEGAGAHFIDGGIVGSPPGRNAPPPRLYVSGLHANLMTAFDGMGIVVRPAGSEPGRASAIKMCYASISKGTNALQMAAMLAAESLGVRDDLAKELSESNPRVFGAIESRIPTLPADAGRYAGEMDEIARTYAAAGVTPLFHEGAAWLMRFLAASPFGDEERETIDKSRGMVETLKVLAELLPDPEREAAE